MNKVKLSLLLTLGLITCRITKMDDFGHLANLTGNYTVPQLSPNDGGTVTVSELPKTVERFEQLRAEIANTPHGAAACFIIALNMFMENPRVGETCLAMSVTHSQRDVGNPKRLASVRQILYDRYTPSAKGSSVYSPWIPCCFFKEFSVNADWRKPKPPYQMIFGVNLSTECRNMDNSDEFYGYSVPLTVDAFSNTTNSKSRYRSVVAVKEKGSKEYVLINFDNLINTASYKIP